MAPQITLIGVDGIPEINPGADLAEIIARAAAAQGTPLQQGDILIVTQKVVSKAEGRIVDLRGVEPSPFAQLLGKQWGKDPRQVELVLRESRRIVKMDRGIIISETHHGFICANAGVDISNIPGEEQASLLPEAPDLSARRIRDEIRRRLGIAVAVIITDTFGRPWRDGCTDVAIGVAGLSPLKDYRGKPDAYGHPLRVSVMATADELAGAAELVMGKTLSIPAAIVRGLEYETTPDGAQSLVRDPSLDLFR